MVHWFSRADASKVRMVVDGQTLVGGTAGL
jgi:hypothetical protein